MWPNCLTVTISGPESATTVGQRAVSAQISRWEMLKRWPTGSVCATSLVALVDSCGHRVELAINFPRGTPCNRRPQHCQDSSQFSIHSNLTQTNLDSSSNTTPHQNEKEARLTHDEVGKSMPGHSNVLVLPKDVDLRVCQHYPCFSCVLNRKLGLPGLSSDSPDRPR